MFRFAGSFGKIRGRGAAPMRCLTSIWDRRAFIKSAPRSPCGTLYLGKVNHGYLARPLLPLFGNHDGCTGGPSFGSGLRRLGDEVAAILTEITAYSTGNR